VPQGRLSTKTTGKPGAGSELVNVDGGDIDFDQYFLDLPEDTNSDPDAFYETNIEDEEVTLEKASLAPGGAGTVPLLSLITGSNFCISIQAGLPLRFAKPQTVTTWSFDIHLPDGATSDEMLMVTAQLGPQKVSVSATDPPLTTTAAFRSPTGRVYAATIRLEPVVELAGVLLDRELGTLMEMTADRPEVEPGTESTYAYGETSKAANELPEHDMSEERNFQAESEEIDPGTGQDENERDEAGAYAYPSSHWNAFDDQTSKNSCEILIDGAETFRRYYEVLMQAQHSISLCCWQLNLDFGIAPVTWAPPFVLEALGIGDKKEWLTIEDVLLWRAMCGVTVRVLIWKHDVQSALEAAGKSVGFTGEWNFEAQCDRLRERCASQRVKMAVLNQYRETLDPTSPYIASSGSFPDADMAFIVCKGPNGVYSCFHEKMLLVDAESHNHAYGFIGGFDIADGRIDPPARLRLRAVSQMLGKNARQAVEATQYRHTFSTGGAGGDEGPAAGLGGMMYMWHDVQIMLHGHATEQLFLHFRQRWAHVFYGDAAAAMKVTQTPVPRARVTRHPRRAHTRSRLHHHSTVQLSRGWQGVFNGHAMMEDFCHFIHRAESLLYIEHQYVQAPAIAKCLRDALRAKPNLRIIIVTAVKTDLPVGLAGRIFNASTKGPSEESMAEVLLSIHSEAPDRVGVYGLLWVHPVTASVKTIYVHSKVMIADDAAVAIGSTNLDTFSFFNSSELTAIVSSTGLAVQTRMRLAKEHLGPHYKPARDIEHVALFDTFRNVADQGFNQLMLTRKLEWRVVPLVPRATYESVRAIAEYPSGVEKVLRKVGVATVLENGAEQLRNLGTAAVRSVFQDGDSTERRRVPEKYVKKMEMAKL